VFQGVQVLAVARVLRVGKFVPVAGAFVVAAPPAVFLDTKLG
jgi:hypothetical protein